MSPSIRIAVCLGLIVGLSACSRADQHKATNDLKQTAMSLPGAIREGTNSPAGEEFKEGAKDLAKDTGKALKEGAKETKEALDRQIEKEKR